MDARPQSFYQVLRLYQMVTEQLWDALSPVGLTPNQFTVLSMVRLMAPTTSAALARRIGVTAQSAGETVKALAEMGLLDREVSPDHKRLLLLTLSASGKRVLARADRLVVRAEQQMFACLGPGANAGFHDAMRVLRANHRQRSARKAA